MKKQTAKLKKRKAPKAQITPADKVLNTLESGKGFTVRQLGVATGLASTQVVAALAWMQRHNKKGRAVQKCRVSSTDVFFLSRQN